MSTLTEPAGIRAALVPVRWWRAVAAPLLAPTVRVVVRVGGIATGLGWIVGVAGAVAAIAGWRYQWWELTTIASIVAVLVALSLLFLVGRTGFETRLDLSRTRVVVGERAVGALQLTNPGTRALLPVRVELPVGKGLATFQVPRLAGGATHEELFAIPTHRRAVLKVGPVSAVRGDPVGLFARTVTWSDPVDLFVHPRTVPMDGSSSGFLQDLEGLPTSALSNADLAFHALRPYVPGDDRRHVHWRTSAKTGELMVKQYQETRRSHLAIALSLNRDEYAREEEVELGIAVAGSLGLQALKEDKQLTVLVQGATLPSRAGKPFLDSLSGLDLTDPRRGSVVDLALATGIHVPDASVAVLICGSFVTPAAVRRAAAYVPVGVRVVAIYAAPGASVTRRTIGDTVVLTLGVIDDLPHAMRRIAA
jgi:uncharacterized protein (DUF58 family)